VTRETFGLALRRGRETRPTPDPAPRGYVLDFDPPCAHEIGQVRGPCSSRESTVSRMDLMIASVALGP